MEPTTLLAVFAAFAAAMLLMAVGVLAKCPCLESSCGGMGHADDGPGCAGCPNRRREA